MEEIYERDDALGRLVREEGLLKTSSDFTARVMQSVKEAPLKAEKEYKPLLSRRTWILILLGILAMTAISRFAIVSDKTTDIAYPDRLKPAADFINGIQFSFNLAPDTLMLATIIIATAGLLLLLDYFVNRLKLGE